MSTNIKVIKFTTKVAVVLAVITYLISLNISYEWFDIKWCSNSFLLTIFGGAFASTLVVLICEIQKYHQNKKDTLNSMIRNLGMIFGWLKIIEFNLKKFQQNASLEVSKEFLVNYQTSLSQAADMLKSVDYKTYISSDNSYSKHIEFNKWLQFVFTSFVNECTYLQIAVNTDQIENLQKYHTEGKITSSSDNTGKVINKLLKSISDMLLKIDEYAHFIDQYANNDIKWESSKMAINLIVDYEVEELNDYLNQDD